MAEYIEKIVAIFTENGEMAAAHCNKVVVTERDNGDTVKSGRLPAEDITDEELEGLLKGSSILAQSKKLITENEILERELEECKDNLSSLTEKHNRLLVALSALRAKGASDDA